MNNPTLSGAAESAGPDAALPTSSTPTSGVQETPGVFASNAIAVAQPPAPGPDLPDTSHLSPAQLIVFAALASGERAQVAAERVGVSNWTIFDWRRRDPRFIAAMNAWRAKTRENIRQKVQQIHQLAFEKFSREYEQLRAGKKRRGKRDEP